MTDHRDESPPRKRAKRAQLYRSEYKQLWPCIDPSKRKGYVYCTVCKKEFSIAHGGKDDCRRYVNCKTHQDYLKLQTGNTTVTKFFPTAIESSEQRVAEVLFSNFIIEHNLPFSVSDHAAPMFPDSDIAKQYPCRRTKTAAIVNCIGKNASETISESLRNASFALSTDGSNDKDSQLYPIVARYLNTKVSKVVSSVLCIPSCTGNSTGENIFDLVNKALENRNISWQNCLAFGCDNASVMTGKHKGVAKFVCDQNCNIFIRGCLCHLIHIAAKKAAAELKLDVEELLIDIYYYLDKSSKRNCELKEFQLFCEIKTHKIIKHVATRWLSS